jgi:hypothetical protein
VENRKGLEVEMSENLAEHYALPTPQEVEDEITEQRSKDSLHPPKPTISWWALPGAGKAIST